MLNKQPGQEPVKPECGVGRWKDRIYWGMDKWTAQGWGVTRRHRRWKPHAVAAPVAHRPAILHAWSVEGGMADGSSKKQDGFQSTQQDGPAPRPPQRPAHNQDRVQSGRRDRRKS